MEDVRRIDVEVDAYAALRVQPRQRAAQPVGRVGDRALRVRRRTRGGGPRVRQVVFDLALHRRDLLRHRRGELRIAGAGQRPRLVGENREGRLQPVSEVTRPRVGARHERFVVGEQPVEVIDERLHLARVLALQPAFRSAANVREVAPDGLERTDRGANEVEPRDHADRGERRRRVAVEMDDPHPGEQPRVERHEDGDHAEQAEAPEHGAEHDPPAQRTHAVGSPAAAIR